MRFPGLFAAAGDSDSARKVAYFFAASSCSRTFGILWCVNTNNVHSSQTFLQNKSNSHMAPSMDGESRGKRTLGALPAANNMMWRWVEHLRD